MISQIINTVKTVENLICTILSIIFCALALFVLVYYIRRRYKLYKEIHRIPQELLIMDSYKNHLKNLKIKCIINNFIIVILIIEFMLNFGEILVYIPYVIKYFVKEPGLNIREIQSYSFLFYLPICYSLVPVLSMMMDFLWLAYRKYEYKYTIIRWTWYIVIRISVNLFVDYSSIDISIPLLKNLPIIIKLYFMILSTSFMELYPLSILYNLYIMPGNSIYN